MAMQQDPAFKQLVSKSFILKKYDDIQIPLIKKSPTIKNHLVTTFFVSSLLHFLIYPLDTIKARIIANNKISDVAKFNANKTTTLTSYLGIFRGYLSVMIASTCHLTLGKQNFILAGAVEGILKTWIDISKVSKQMGNNKLDLQIMKRTFGVSATFAILRDLSYRGLYLFFVNRLTAKFIQTARLYNQTVKTNIFFGSVIMATIISQPFQVCFVKIASQRQLKYKNLLKLPIQIIKEQGFGKLALSGLWPRLVYNILSTTILINTYDSFLEITLEAL